MVEGIQYLYFCSNESLFSVNTEIKKIKAAVTVLLESLPCVYVCVCVGFVGWLVSGT